METFHVVEVPEGSATVWGVVRKTNEGSEALVTPSFKTRAKAQAEADRLAESAEKA